MPCYYNCGESYPGAECAHYLVSFMLRKAHLSENQVKNLGIPTGRLCPKGIPINAQLVI